MGVPRGSMEVHGEGLGGPWGSTWEPWGGPWGSMGGPWEVLGGPWESLGGSMGEDWGVQEGRLRGPGGSKGVGLEGPGAWCSSIISVPAKGGVPRGRRGW